MHQHTHYLGLLYPRRLVGTLDDLNITAVQYIDDGLPATASIKSVVNGEIISVPNNALDNRHYAEIMRQVEAGDLTIQDAD